VDRGTAPGRPLSDSGPGLFGPGSLTWQLDREAFLLLGAGPRALLLQIAHPAVAAGVGDHSTFRTDPWGRLAGTLRSYLRIVYGSTTAARAEIRRLNELHAGVRGAMPGGGSYRARDPELSLWVHATLVDSTIATADAWLGPLDASARARAYAESLPVGRAFGIPASMLPADGEAFDAYIEAMLSPSGPVHPGPLARELAATILHPPPGPAIRTLAGALAGSVPAPLVTGIAAAGDAMPAAAVAWLLWPSIGLLPPGVRDGYALPWGLRERAVSAWLVTAWRAWARLLPEAFRQMPQARAADRRIGVGGTGSGGTGSGGGGSGGADSDAGRP
jgi:uncharacterized protein (DUF2236 family)